MYVILVLHASSRSAHKRNQPRWTLTPSYWKLWGYPPPGGVLRQYRVILYAPGIELQGLSGRSTCIKSLSRVYLDTGHKALCPVSVRPASAACRFRHIGMACCY